MGEQEGERVTVYPRGLLEDSRLVGSSLLHFFFLSLLLFLDPLPSWNRASELTPFTAMFSQA